MEDKKILESIKVFEEDTNSLKTLRVKKGVGDYGWNKYLFVPLENFEIAYIHPDQSDVNSGYIRVIHSKYNCISVFSKCHFDFI
jgi:hypothetical protein